MKSVFKFLLLAGASLIWLFPAYQAFHILDGLNGMDMAPDASNLREALDAVKRTIGFVGMGVVAWLIHITTARPRQPDSDAQFAHLADMHRQLACEFERFQDTLRHSHAAFHSDFGNFTSVGTRLRSALEARLSGIEALLQAPRAAAAPVQAPSKPGLDERLAALEHTVETSMRDLAATLAQRLHGLQSELSDRDQQTSTDFSALDTRMSDDAHRWEERLRSLEHCFAELTRKTTLDGAQVTANLKLMSLRLKDLTQAVQH